MEREKLYKLDNAGKTRVWWVNYDVETGAYSVNSGILGGAIVASKPKFAKPKNVGKKNETSVEQQTLSEVQSLYNYQLYQGKYYPTVEEAGNGAKYYEPMLAEKEPGLPKNAKKLKWPMGSQPKLDGARCINTPDLMQTREGLEFVSCPHIREELEEFMASGIGLPDGELYNHELKSDFEKIISLVRRRENLTEEHYAETRRLVQFHVYDIITPEPMDYLKRYDILQRLCEGKQFIKLTPMSMVHSMEEAEEKLLEYFAEGYEGGMLRNLNMPYEHKRSNALWKHKDFDDAEFIIEEIEEGTGNWAGAAKGVQLRMANGTIGKATLKGSYENGKKILEEAESLKGTLATARFAKGLTKDGKIRFGVITYLWRTDKRDM